VNIIKKELQYFLLVLKKFWAFLLIPTSLSIYLYIIFTINFNDIETAIKMQPVLEMSYNILKILLPVLWAMLYVWVVLYICKLHFKLRVRIKTFVFITVGYFLYVFLGGLIQDLLFQNWLFKPIKILDIIGCFAEFIFFMLLFPFCILKIRHLIKINIIFIRKYFMIIILLIISYILLSEILGEIAVKLPKMEFIDQYAFANPAQIITNFPLILTIICYKNRKIIKTNIRNIFRRKIPE
jgi:hypothetical protein